MTNEQRREYLRLKRVRKRIKTHGTQDYKARAAQRRSERWEKVMLEVEAEEKARIEALEPTKSLMEGIEGEDKPDGN